MSVRTGLGGRTVRGRRGGRQAVGDCWSRLGVGWCVSLNSVSGLSACTGLGGYATTASLPMALMAFGRQGLPTLRLFTCIVQPREIRADAASRPTPAVRRRAPAISRTASADTSKQRRISGRPLSFRRARSEVTAERVRARLATRSAVRAIAEQPETRQGEDESAWRKATSRRLRSPPRSARPPTK